MNKRLPLTLVLVTLLGVIIAGTALANSTAYSFDVSIPGWGKQSTYNQRKDYNTQDAEVFLWTAQYGVKGRLQTADGSKSGTWNNPLTVGTTEYLSPPSGTIAPYDAHVQFGNLNIHTNQVTGVWIPR